MSCPYCGQTEVSEKYGNCIGCGRYRREEIKDAEWQMRSRLVLMELEIQRDMMASINSEVNDRISEHEGY